MRHSLLAARRFLFSQGFTVAPVVKPERIVACLRKFQPRKLDKELIRVGGDSDGGYLVPDDLDGIGYCLSPGVSDRATFEADLYKRGTKPLLADYSVDTPPALPECKFRKRFLGTVDDDIFITMPTWISEDIPADDTGDLICQMDIEGAEYSILLDLPENIMSRFRILVVEFHYLYKLFDSLNIMMAEALLNKLGKHFHIAHVHANNCEPAYTCKGLRLPPHIEVTMLRKDRAQDLGPATQLPHPLDVRCVKRLPEIELGAEWFLNGH